MRVRVEVEGHAEAKRQLRRIGDQAPAIQRRVFERANDRVVVAAKQICPVDDRDGGQLRDSIRRTRSVSSSGTISSGVVAGGIVVDGVNVDYAEQQHEDLTLKHRVGQGKFIEIPFMREASRVPGELIAETDKVAARA